MSSTVKFLSSLAVEDESPAAPVTPTSARTRPRKNSPPAASSSLSSTNPLIAAAPPLREAAGLSRGRSGTVLPGLPRPVHVQSHAPFPGTAALIPSRSISVPATPQQSATTLASSAVSLPLTPPMSPVVGPLSTADAALSRLPASATHPSSRSHTTSAFGHPSPSKRPLLDDSHPHDSMATSPILQVTHRRSASLSHMGLLSLPSSIAEHAGISAVQKNGVMLEAYKPVQADNKDAIEAEVADKPHQPAVEESIYDTANVNAAHVVDATPIPDASATPLPRSPTAVNGDSTPATDVSPSSSMSPLSVSDSPTKATTPDHPRNVRLLHFQRLLNEETLDLSALRSLAWNGVPAECRADVWRLLLGYLPLSRQRRESMLDKRRQEYITFLRQHYLSLSSTPASASLDTEMLNQIQQDVPRTSPAYQFFKRPAIQTSLERVLFIFSIRHPASGYVQGMNDLVTPFYCVMLDAAVTGGAEMVLGGDRNDDARVSESVMLAVEADCYWCLSSFLDAVQDHYTFAQPGIQRCVYRLSSLVEAINPTLHTHLETEQVSFMHFAFRWMNCLLMREMSLPCTIRLFDTYIASSSDGSSGGLSSFASFHVYVCTAFLLQWSKQLAALDFQELILFLQRPPTERWSVRDVEALIAQAYVYQCWEEKGGARASGGVGGIGGAEGEGGGAKGLLLMNGVT